MRSKQFSIPAKQGVFGSVVYNIYTPGESWMKPQLSTILMHFKGMPYFGLLRIAFLFKNVHVYGSNEPQLGAVARICRGVQYCMEDHHLTSAFPP